MNCTECKEKFVEYIEGLLPDNQKQEVEAHLKNCRQCQTELEQLNSLGKRLTSDSENKQSMDSTGSPQADFENAVFNRIVREQNKRLKQAAGINRQLNIWRIIMKSRITKFAAAAAVVLIMLGGITIWPSRSVQNSKWWLEPSTAWGQEVLKSLDTIKTISCMEHIMLVRADGTAHVSRTWNKLYVSKDSYRKDIYDGNNLTETQWYLPDGNGMVQTSVRFDLGHYFISRHVGGFGVADPVERMSIF
jgi:hypothetical protein